MPNLSQLVQGTEHPGEIVFRHMSVVQRGVRDSAGHASVLTTQRYSHMFDDPLRAAVKKVGGIIGAAGQKGSKKLSAPLLYDAHCCHIWVGAPFAFPARRSAGPPQPRWRRASGFQLPPPDCAARRSAGCSQIARTN